MRPMRSLVRAQLLLLTRWGIGSACVIAYALCMALTVAVCLWNPGILASSLREAGVIDEGAAWLIAEGSAAGSVSITWTEALSATIITDVGILWFACLTVASRAAQDFETGAIRTVLLGDGLRPRYAPAQLLASLPLVVALFLVGTLAAPLTCALCGVTLVDAPPIEALAWLAQLALVLLAYLALVLLAVMASKSTLISIVVALLLSFGMLENALTSLLYLVGSGGLLPQLTLGAAQAMEAGSLLAIMGTLAGGHATGPVGFVVPTVVLVAGAGAATLIMCRRELGR